LIICRNLKVLNLRFALEYDLGNPLDNPATWMEFGIIDGLQELQIQLEIYVVNNLHPPADEWLLQYLWEQQARQAQQVQLEQLEQLARQAQQEQERHEQQSHQEWQEQRQRQRRQLAAAGVAEAAGAARVTEAVGAAGAAGTTGAAAGETPDFHANVVASMA